MRVWLAMVIGVLLVALPSCAEATGPAPIRIMAAGDSITLGVVGGQPMDGTPGGYRVRFQQNLTRAGITFDMVGSLQSGPSGTDRDHEGYPGHRIDQLDVELQRDVPIYRPDVILLMVGTNDIEQDFRVPGSPPLSAAPDRFRLLLEHVHALSPATHLVIATLPPLTLAYVPQAKQKAEWLSDQIALIVFQRKADGWPVTLVQANTLLSETDLSDRVHLTPDGYDKLGDLWATVLAGSVPQPSTPCNPRPAIRVRSTTNGAGLAVVVTAKSAISGIRFGATVNAAVSGLQIVGDTATFSVARQSAGQVMVPFVVTDACGPWQTFVGQGA